MNCFLEQTFLGIVTNLDRELSVDKINGILNSLSLANKNKPSSVSHKIKDLYPVHVWSQRVAYVVGSGDQTEVVNREYVHPVNNYKLSKTVKIGDKEYSFDWKDSSGKTVTEVNTSSSSVTVYGPEKLLKIPVRVKINYDPSNKLETWAEKNLKHEFYRKIDGGAWKKMYEEKQYIYDVICHIIQILNMAALHSVKTKN